jgi:hypothetical protein
MISWRGESRRKHLAKATNNLDMVSSTNFRGGFGAAPGTSSQLAEVVFRGCQFGMLAAPPVAPSCSPHLRGPSGVKFWFYTPRRGGKPGVQPVPAPRYYAGGPIPIPGGNPGCRGCTPDVGCTDVSATHVKRDVECSRGAEMLR